MTDDIQRDLGRLEAQVHGVVKQLDELDRDVKAISATLSEAKGGWRLLMLLSGVSAAVGGLIVKFAPYVVSMGPR